MRTFVASVVAVLVLAGGGSAARADLGQGLQSVARGEYKLAKRAFLETSGADKARAQLELARLMQVTGDYKGAESQVRRLLKSKDKALAIDAHILLAEVLRQTGQYRVAKSTLEGLRKGNEKHLALRHALGLAYHDLGMDKEAKVLWNQFFDEADQGGLDSNNASHQFYLAESAQFLGSFSDANNVYQEVPEIDANFHLASLRLGQKSCLTTFSIKIQSTRTR